MYDAERRNAFLEYYKGEASKEYYGRVFDRIEPVENQLGKHLEEMTTEESREVFKVFSMMRTASVTNVFQMFKNYKEWCMENGIGFTPELDQSAFNASSTMSIRMVSSPQQLQERLDAVFDKESLKTNDNLYRAYLWLLFIGVTREQAIALRDEDVDLSIPCVYVDGVPYKIPPEAFPCFYVVATCDAFVVPHPSHRDSVKRRVESDKFLRGIKSDSSIRYLENRISLKSSETGVFVNGNDTYYSGVMYRIYLTEKETGTPDFTQYVQSRLADSEGYKNQSYRGKQKWYNKVLSFVRKDYNNWKDAFAL